MVETLLIYAYSPKPMPELLRSDAESQVSSERRSLRLGAALSFYQACVEFAGPSNVLTTIEAHLRLQLSGARRDTSRVSVEMSALEAVIQLVEDDGFLRKLRNELFATHALYLLQDKAFIGPVSSTDGLLVELLESLLERTIRDQMMIKGSDLLNLMKQKESSCVKDER